MNTFLSALRIFIVLVILTGVAYPLMTTGLAQAFLPNQANGSLVKQDGRVVGSELIGQLFVNPIYFQPRPSACNYEAIPSGASNLSIKNDSLIESVNTRSTYWKKPPQKIPVDLLFASGSGLDPHISPEAAYFQLDSVAEARAFNPEQKQALKNLVDQSIAARQFNLFGQSTVNVLLLNRKLDILTHYGTNSKKP